jgi:hypothetical protein
MGAAGYLLCSAESAPQREVAEEREVESGHESAVRAQVGVEPVLARLGVLVPLDRPAFVGGDDPAPFGRKTVRPIGVTKETEAEPVASDNSGGCPAGLS